MQEEPTRTQSASSRTKPYPPWDPVFAYNNLPPVPRERLTTPAVEARCEIATRALNTLREATARFSDPVTLMQTLALVEAQASSAIEGIVTTVHSTGKRSPGQRPPTRRSGSCAAGSAAGRPTW